ncbi:MAG TPA: FAD-binding protein, partial [Burkholderiaceae bacterium]|nr:FAD-binding protein [Burkholderiaceae bacterium]
MLIAPSDPAAISARRQQVADALRAVLPARCVLSDPEDTRPYECDGLAAYRQLPMIVTLPDSEAQVVAIIDVCRRLQVPIVPRGAGTGLSGGAMPIADGVVLSTARLNQIVRMDAYARTAVVQPGVRNLAISDAAARHDLYYAPDPSSQIACTIGGNVAENSGGVHCLKYGLTVHNVLRVRMVTIEGEVVELGGEALDAPGLDLLAVFIGSEGMLGIVTEVTVRLIPKPSTARVIMASFGEVGAGCNAVADLIAAGIIPAGLEMMDQTSARMVEPFCKAGYDTDAEAILLCESDGLAEEVEEEIGRMSAVLKQSGATAIAV